ncbi:MAG: long-chain fatty acid--CoA ligase [Holophagales bacterium]|jgi:long-chain acyl-CoA synthetase|nr:long-chain fatty acid--CoA ligase [Holophagales bacterium]
MFLRRVEKTPDREAYLFPEGNGWTPLTWRQVGEKVKAIACGLRALGLGDEDRASILSATRMDWILADLGILAAGGATTTIYPSSTTADCLFILQDSGTRILLAESREQADRIAAKRSEVPDVKAIVVFDGAGSDDGYVLTLDALMEKGRAWDAANPGRYEKIVDAVRTDSLATLIYTSGTTGRPKGVELTHDCWLYEAEGIDELKLLNEDDRQYFWLPLAHSFGKVLEAAQLRIGFSTAIDGRVEKIVENLGQVKPTFVAAVPRIFEKIYNKVTTGAKDAGGAKWAIFSWAFGVGREVSKLRLAGQEPAGLLALKHAVAHKLVFSKLHALFGGRIRCFVSGSAPLARPLGEFFHAAGIVVLEGYGLTETSAASCVNTPEKLRFGTVGAPLPGTSIRIAEDGEILLKGRGVMRGYHNLPDQTAETLDAEGWLHTGDIGHVEDGFVKITDRKKDLIKTSGGKYVAPQMLEKKLTVACPYVSHSLAHGDNRNFVSMLIALDPEAITKWAGAHGLEGKSYAEIVKSAEVRALIAPFIDEVNKDTSAWEQVKKWEILPADLTLEAGDLTPSMKLKRKTVEQKYRSELDGFYEESAVRL